MIEIISATRLSPDEFWSGAALAHSLRRILPDERSIETVARAEPETGRITAHIAFSNTRALPEIYNARITGEDSDALLVFMHDDVWIDDFFFARRVVDALREFDVVGVAGNRSRRPGQARWAEGDATNLSGRVAHGPHPFGDLTYFGPSPAKCELLDGVCLAARRSVLRAHGVLFDARFDFHFYDLDFCRAAASRGLRLGTWPIALTHQSAGAFAGDVWRRNRDVYLGKWKD